MNIHQAQKIHCIGIGGIGLSSIAQILKQQHKDISGSDLVPSELTASLADQGIQFFPGHDPANIPEGSELIIYSPAIPENNVELERALQLSIPAISYPQALGELSQKYFTIAVTGTHGKSTTTGMISKIFLEANQDPTIVIGTKLQELNNSNYRYGKSQILILEACEYRESFSYIKPDILVITNIEAEHLDYYQNAENYYQAFKKFAANLKPAGKVILNGSDEVSKNLFEESTSNIFVDTTRNIQLSLPGQFNQQNANLALKAASICKLNEENALRSLKEYRGSWRRLEIKKTENGTIFIDDYAHHPTEIKLTIRAIREKYPNQKILCVFQPHQYNRTWHFLTEFGRSFAEVDRVIIPNIYQVRDSADDLKKVSTQDLVDEINSNSANAINGEGIEHSAKIVNAEKSQYPIVLTMGAGDINEIYNYL